MLREETIDDALTCSLVTGLLDEQVVCKVGDGDFLALKDTDEHEALFFKVLPLTLVKFDGRCFTLSLVTLQTFVFTDEGETLSVGIFTLTSVVAVVFTLGTLSDTDEDEEAVVVKEGGEEEEEEEEEDDEEEEDGEGVHTVLPLVTGVTTLRTMVMVPLEVTVV